MEDSIPRVCAGAGACLSTEGTSAGIPLIAKEGNEHRTKRS
jgi:hypothetical protein